MARGLIALIRVEFRDKIWRCKIFFVSSHLENKYIAEIKSQTVFESSKSLEH